MNEFIYDYTKLEKRMEKYRFSQVKLAEKIPISRNSLNQKLNNRVYFTQREIKRVCEILEIPSSKIGLYFFDLVVQKNRTTVEGNIETKQVS